MYKNMKTPYLKEVFKIITSNNNGNFKKGGPYDIVNLFTINFPRSSGNK